MSVSRPGVRQVLRVVGFLVLLSVVVPFVVYAVPQTVGADGSYVVLSGSMEPAIEVGDVVIVDEVDPATIREGDVITYLRAGEETPTTHRVVEVVEAEGELAFRTMGDANENPDSSPVAAERVTGKVIFVIPFVGYVVEFANTPEGFAALVAVPFALLVLSEAYAFLQGARGRASRTAGADGTDSHESVERAGPESAATGANSDSDAPEPIADARGTQGGPTGDDHTIAITRTDLRLSLSLLVGITAYSAWVVTHLQEAWSFAVAFASGIGLVLVAGMYYLAGTRTRPEFEPDPGPKPERAEGSASADGGWRGEAASEGRDDAGEEPSGGGAHAGGSAFEFSTSGREPESSGNDPRPEGRNADGGEP